MKLVETLVVRDEADIVDAQIRHHLNLGVDFVIATDHGSTDGTTEILESYERQLADFASCISERRDPRATLADGIAAVRCVDAASRSAARGGAEVIL